MIIRIGEPHTYHPKPILVYTLENQLRVDDLMTLGERLEDSH